VKGRFYVNIDSKAEKTEIVAVLDKIRDFLTNNGYNEYPCKGRKYKYTNIEFNFRLKAPDWKGFVEELSTIQNGLPFRIIVSLYPECIDDKTSIIIDVVSEPAIIHKCQLGHPQPNMQEDPFTDTKRCLL